MNKACYFTLLRLLTIIQELRANRFPNCSNLAVQFEVSRRTIQRDFDALRYYFHAPLRYSAQQRGFYLTKPDWKFEI